jgi:hypothetical protein
MESRGTFRVSEVVWDLSDADLDRAFSESSQVARKFGLPSLLLKYCRIEPIDSASDQLYDSVVVGVDFSYVSSGVGDLSFRFVGPFYDRLIILRFSNVIHYDAKRASHFDLGEIHWLEFFEPDEKAAQAIGWQGDRSSEVLGCHMHMLTRRDRHTVLFQAVDLASRHIPRQKACGDFALI